MEPIACLARSKRCEYHQSTGHLRGANGCENLIPIKKRFDCHSVNQVPLNLNCRDEIIPVLRSLQHIYSMPTLRQEILGLVASDVNHDSRHDRGREGLDYWQVLVLAGVRLGCDLNYDKLQDLAEQHRALRHIMGIGDWQEHIDCNWRRIRDNVCLLRSATIEKICHALVAEGHALAPDAAKRIRVDSFVMETNVHYPTESWLIDDGVRKVIELSVDLADELNLSGWRQHQHLLKFGRLLLVYEDAAGFIVHQHLMDRVAQDVDVAVEQTRTLLGVRCVGSQSPHVGQAPDRS